MGVLPSEVDCAGAKQVRLPCICECFLLGSCLFIIHYYHDIIKLKNIMKFYSHYFLITIIILLQWVGTNGSWGWIAGINKVIRFGRNNRVTSTV